MSVISPPPTRSRVLPIAWVLLLLLGLFFLIAPAADLAGDARQGLPTDHQTTFTKVAGTSFASVRQSVPGTARYVTLLERGYALHELTFGLLFLAIVAVPFRRRERWAWWACWAVMVANLGYTLTFGRHDQTVLWRSLIGDVALPVLLLVTIPAFFFHPREAARAAS
ncbi:MAG TPA: hypothetical protein VF995_04940 [Actinomycetota bacterium]